MAQQFGKILTLLIPLLEQITSDTLYLVMETIRAVVALEKGLLDPRSVGELANRVYTVWLQNSTGTFPLLPPGDMVS
jgi:hypothetical protein